MAACVGFGESLMSLDPLLSDSEIEEEQRIVEEAIRRIEVSTTSAVRPPERAPRPVGAPEIRQPVKRRVPRIAIGAFAAVAMVLTEVAGFTYFGGSPLLDELAGGWLRHNDPQRYDFGAAGWLYDSGNDHGVEFKSFLMNKRLVATREATYYVGVERTETVVQGTRGSLLWSFRARCAARSHLRGSMPLGIYSSMPNQPEQFTLVTGPQPPDNASRGWYSLWWAVCQGVPKKF